ncbi:hypothetical protein OGAPHI_006338 [Ogataea philodendri]|uniref:Zn(2)-C6 fungal-type domain-containing protein n=1 Tax=Ogataea philodendri TaxID=1378263 RepID=A0A9P8T1B0_9ASCO|nr:uncharacterized protein OGAPHI_006338 [Ogataea philodendri]KAH3661491.1 hypothetical protein OGAPHI_006338 [Ogataea philodendri]
MGKVRRACTSCKRRRVKCNFEIPCSRCIDRDRASLCTRDPVESDVLLAKGQEDELFFARENKVLKRRIRELEETIFQEAKARGAASRATFTSRNSSPVAVDHDRAWKTYAQTVGALKQALVERFTDVDSLYAQDIEEWALFKSTTPTSAKTEIWNQQLRMVNSIDKSQSDIILQAAVDVSFLHNVLDTDEFLLQYNNYWQTEQEKHVTPFYSKNEKTYLFMSQYYAMMCIGSYYSDDALQKRLGYSDADWDSLSRAFFSCAYHCLSRGRFLTYPDLRAIQSFGLMRICCQVVGGVDLQYSLLGNFCYHARNLDLDKLTENDDQLKIRCWWSLVITDWYDSDFRTSMIMVDSFTTPLPNRWIAPKLINEQNMYQIMGCRVSTIKKRYYFAPRLSAQHLRIAESELLDLEKQTIADLSYASSSFTATYSRFLAEYLFLYERLTIYCRMCEFCPKHEWLASYYAKCVSCATDILLTYTSDETPAMYRKPWFMPDVAVSAALFLLVDLASNKDTQLNKPQVLGLAEKLLVVLRSYRQTIRPALRGAYIVEKLMHVSFGRPKSATPMANPWTEDRGWREFVSSLDEFTMKTDFMW